MYLLQDKNLLFLLRSTYNGTYQIIIRRRTFMDFLNLLSQYRTPAGDVFFQGITLLAQETFVVVVICWLFWCSNKKLAYCLGFTYFTSGLLVQGLK